jgi:4-methylaminobutanoate oxidase (formaldehyde-forming)
LLAPIVSIDLLHTGTPFASLWQAELGMAPVRQHRVSYVGQFGWESNVASDMARQIFDKRLPAIQLSNRDRRQPRQCPREPGANLRSPLASNASMAGA